MSDAGKTLQALAMLGGAGMTTDTPDTTRLSERLEDLHSKSRWLLDGSTQGNWQWGNNSYPSVQEAAEAARQAILNTGTQPTLYFVDVEGQEPIICLTGNGPSASHNAELIAHAPDLIRDYRNLASDIHDHIGTLTAQLADRDAEITRLREALFDLIGVAARVEGNDPTLTHEQWAHAINQGHAALAAPSAADRDHAGESGE